METVEVNGARLAYEVAGEGPPVVLVHAAIADSRQWDREFARLTERRQVLRYDMRGFGRSTPPPGPLSHARDLLGLMDNVGFERAALIGSSMGGRVAMEIAVAAPERVSALVVIGSGLPGRERSDELQAYAEREDELLEAGKIDEAVELNLDVWVRDPEVRDRVREMQLRTFEHDLAVPDAGPEEPIAPDFAQRLPEISAPTLVLVGGEDVRDHVEATAEIAAAIPGSSRTVIEGAAHLPNLEKPEEFERLVLEFLEAVQ
jgi:3-oxoadipate enol-lactonase